MISNANNFNLRGFDASGNIFVDGARDSGSYSRDIFNVEQVEIAKGPASDNGRSGAGGTRRVNCTAQNPQITPATGINATNKARANAS